MRALQSILKKNIGAYTFVMRFDPENYPVHILDLSAKNHDLENVDIDSEADFSQYISESIRQAGASYAVGGYAENRIVYSRSEVFEGDRSVHLGIDLWAEAGEEIFAPLGGSIHSFKDNSSHGDYGPTILLEHTLNGVIFYTLYGHLSKKSLYDLYEGKKVNAGERIGWLGDYHENVHWPPHLHFQVIADIDGKKGDYPGVARPSEANRFLENCPDPNLILGVTALNNNKVSPGK